MPSSRASTLTIGKPPWKIHESMIRRTGSPEASSMASHRSVVSVLPYWWLAMYLRMPARNSSSPRYCSSIRTTAAPFS